MIVPGEMTLTTSGNAVGKIECHCGYGGAGSFFVLIIQIFFGYFLYLYNYYGANLRSAAK